MIDPTVPSGQFIVYVAEDGQAKIDVRFQDESVWLTQHEIADLFQTSVANVNKHIRNIIEEGELEAAITSREIVTPRLEGTRIVERPRLHYNLDMIISVGYRVTSRVATRFRMWATERLREYIIKGFTLDDERLKNPDTPFDYFDELTERIQEIRTSERRFYQKITDVYALSADYDPTAEESILFFKTVQNKMHWAINGHTASEIIVERADASQPNMGLTNWRHARIRKSDVTIAKNYLTEEDLKPLNNLSEQFLIFALGQAERRIKMNMADWIAKLDQFLALNDRDILVNAGKVSHDQAVRYAREQYVLYVEKRRELDNQRPREYDAMLEEGSTQFETNAKDKP